MNARSTTEVWLASAETATTANERLAQTKATHIVWVEESGELGVGALQIIEAALARCEVEILYGNSRQSSQGPPQVIRRPAFSPLRLREQDYLGPVIVMNVKWMRSVGGFHNLAAGVHGYDFVLRFVDRAIRLFAFRRFFLSSGGCLETPWHSVWRSNADFHRWPSPHPFRTV